MLNADDYSDDYDSDTWFTVGMNAWDTYTAAYEDGLRMWSEGNRPYAMMMWLDAMNALDECYATLGVGSV